MENDFPKGLFIVAAIIVAIGILVMLVNLTEGAFAFLQDEGTWKWLGIIGGVSIVLLIIYSITKSRE